MVALRWIGIALFLTAAGPARATVIPRVDPDGIADQANVLGGSRGQVAQLIAQAQGSTGVAIRVLTLQSSDEDPKSLSVRALNTWNPGPRSVLLVVVMNPHQIYIQPGTQLAATFDSATASGIASNQIAPLMRQTSDGQAIRVGVASIADHLHRAPALSHAAAEPQQFEAATSAGGGASVPLILLVFAAGAVLTIVLLVKRAFRRRCEKCGAPMNSFQSVLYSPSYGAPGSGETTYTCTGCGDTFTEPYTIAMLNDSGSNSGSSGSSSDGSGGGGSSW